MKIICTSFTGGTVTNVPRAITKGDEYILTDPCHEIVPKYMYNFGCK